MSLIRLYDKMGAALHAASSYYSKNKAFIIAGLVILNIVLLYIIFSGVLTKKYRDSIGRLEVIEAEYLVLQRQYTILVAEKNEIQKLRIEAEKKYNTLKHERDSLLDMLSAIPDIDYGYVFIMPDDAADSIYANELIPYLRLRYGNSH